MSDPGEPTTLEDVATLRATLIRDHGSDFGISDTQLRMYADVAKKKVRESGRRWSWNALAIDDIVRAVEGPSL